MLDRFLLTPAAAGAVPLAAANDNFRLFPRGADPARVLRIVRTYLALLRQEHARSGRLLRCPRERRHFEETRALEQALVWWHFRSG